MKKGVKKGMKKNKKKGLSPVIATVLLIGIVVVIGLIVFTWFKGFTQEAVIKFDQNAELVCNDVEFQASLSGTTLSISNFGNVAIYRIMVKISSPAGFETRNLKDLDDNWPEEGLTQGGAFSGSIGSAFSNADSIKLIPILRGSSQRGGEASFECDENQHGQQISL